MRRSSKRTKRPYKIKSQSANKKWPSKWGFSNKLLRVNIPISESARLRKMSPHFSKQRPTMKYWYKRILTTNMDRSRLSKEIIMTFTAFAIASRKSLTKLLDTKTIGKSSWAASEKERKLRSNMNWLSIKTIRWNSWKTAMYRLKQWQAIFSSQGTKRRRSRDR